MRTAAFALLLCLADCAAAQTPAPPLPAQGKVLVGFFQPGTSRAEVMQAVRDAFARRGWAIQTSSDDAIKARLTRHGADAGLTIFYADGTLRYAEEGDVRENWLDNLRSDIPRFLMNKRAAAERAERAEAAKARAGNSPSVNAERLRSLKQLYDSGIITREEYDRKRGEILKDL